MNLAEDSSVIDTGSSLPSNSAVNGKTTQVNAVMSVTAPAQSIQD